MLLGQVPGKQDSMMQISVDLTLHNIFVLAKPGQELLKYLHTIQSPL